MGFLMLMRQETASRTITRILSHTPAAAANSLDHPFLHSPFHHLLFCRHRHWAGNKRSPPRRSKRRHQQQQQRQSFPKRGIAATEKQKAGSSSVAAAAAQTSQHGTGAAAASPSRNETEVKTEQSMLQLLRRSRSILACNWRCQLATMNASNSGGTVHGSIVRYVLIGGQPCIWLGQQDHQHDMNLLMDDRMSLILGHSDPVPLIQALKIIGSPPPHLHLFGRLDPVADLDMAKLKKGLKDLSLSVEFATNGASHVLRQILKESGGCVGRWAEAYAEATTPENDYSWYRVLAKSCYYVDSTGVRHKLDLSDLMDGDTLSSDALSPLLPAILEGVNQSEQRRLALMALCVIHRRVRAQDAIMASADRWGFTVLAKVSENTSNEENSAVETAEISFTKTCWKELRFDFDHEVRDADSFCFLLAELERQTLRFIQ